MRDRGVIHEQTGRINPNNFAPVRFDRKQIIGRCREWNEIGQQANLDYTLPHYTLPLDGCRLTAC
jgi:hypothetical protein